MSPDPARPATATLLLDDVAWIRTLARSIVADRATADDVAQDATVVALTRRPREPGALRAWLRRVVRNLAVDAHRGAARRATVESGASTPAADEDAGEIVARWEIRRAVVDAVLALDEPYRATVLLRFFEGLTPTEIAARQTVPLDTVKTRQRRALEMLRARLAHLGERDDRRGFSALLLIAAPESRSPAPTAVVNTTTTATFLGGLAMSALSKSLAAAAVVLALAGVWWGTRSSSGEDGTSNRTSVDDGSSASGHVAGRRAPGDASPDAGDAPSALAAAAPADDDAERDLIGVVVDRGDAPVAGAHIAAHRLDVMRWVLASASGTTLGVDSPVATAESAEDGAFRLRLSPGSQSLLRVSAPGFADVEWVGAQPGQPLRIVLDPPTSLTVRVEDADGAACAGATVVASLAFPERVSWRGSAVTGAEGRVTWQGLPRGRGAKVELDVSPGTGVCPAHAECLLEDRDANEAVVTLPRGRTLEGTVVGVEANVPVAGARLFVDSRSPCVAVTDMDGRFRIEGWTRDARRLGDRDARLSVRADDFGLVRVDVPSPGDTRPFVIALRRGYEATGVVVGLDGAPLAGAQWVVVAEVHNDRSLPFLAGAADDQGAFRIGCLPRGGSPRDVHAVVSISSGDFASRVIVLTQPKDGGALLDLGTITLGPGRTVRGRVVGRDGVAVPDAIVRLLTADDDGRLLGESRVCRPDGRFTFAGVAAGNYRAACWKRDVSPDEASVEFAVATDVDPSPVTLVLGAPPPAPPARVTLATRVVDEDGVPVAGVPFGVGMAAGGRFTGVVRSGAGGSLDVPCDGLPQYVSTRLEGDLATRYLPNFTWLRPGATRADVVLKRAAPVTGTVVDVEGRALANAWVYARIGARQVGYGVTDADGRFAFGVPPGSTVDLEGKPPLGALPFKPDVAVLCDVAAGSANVILRITPVPTGRSLDVVLVLPEGPDWGECTMSVAFHGQPRERRSFFAFDASGRVRLDDLPFAPVDLRVGVRLSGEGDLTCTGLTPFRVDADATSARVVAPGFRTVRGRVVDASGAPSPGAYLFSTAGGNGSSTLADADGVFALRVPSEAPLPFLVTASKYPFDRAAPEGGWEIVEDEGERVIVLRPQKPR